VCGVACCGFTCVDVGRPVLVTAQFTQGSRPSAELDAPAALRIETPAIVLPALNQAVWRIVATAPGDYEVRVRIADAEYAKTIHVSGGLSRHSPVWLAPRLLDEVAYPSEAPLPRGAPISMIQIDYPQSGIDVLGRRIHWMVIYVILSVVFAVFLRRPLRVTI